MGLKPITPKADTLNYNYKKYRVQFYSLSSGGNPAWTDVTNFQTSTPLSNGYGVSAISVRIGTTSGSSFVAGTTYRVIVDTGLSPISEKQYLIYDHTGCYGSANTTNWSADATKIADCELIGIQDVNNSVHRKFVYEITPAVSSGGIQFNIYFTGTAQFTSINVYNNTSVSYGPDIAGAIEEQTIIITEEIQNAVNDINITIENVIDQEHEYTGQEEIDSTDYYVDQIEQSEQNILNNIVDFATDPWNIEGDPTTLAWIWNKVEIIFLNSMVNTFFITILTLGAIKLILGR